MIRLLISRISLRQCAKQTRFSAVKVLAKQHYRERIPESFICSGGVSVCATRSRDTAKILQTCANAAVTVTVQWHVTITAGCLTHHQVWFPVDFQEFPRDISTKIQYTLQFLRSIGELADTYRGLLTWISTLILVYCELFCTETLWNTRIVTNNIS